MSARPLTAVEAGEGRVGGILTDLATRITGNVATRGVDAMLLTAERRAELGLRLLPGIPSDWQWGSLALLAIGLAGAGVSWRWWSALWPAERGDDYAGRMGLIAARLTRAISFAALFMPLVGLPALVARLLGLARRGSA